MTNSQGQHNDEEFGDVPITPLGLGGSQLERNDWQNPMTSDCSFWAPVVTAVTMAFAMPRAAPTPPGEW